MNTSITEAEKTKAAGAATPTALKNPNLDYAPLADLVQWNIDGQRLAGTFLQGMNCQFFDCDALYFAVKLVTGDCLDTEALTTLRGFMRILQKRLERGSA